MYMYKRETGATLIITYPSSLSLLKSLMMMLCIYYLCNSSISFAISVPILPAPRTVPEDIPGTVTKDCFTASGDKERTPKQNFKHRAVSVQSKDLF